MRTPNFNDGYRGEIMNMLLNFGALSYRGFQFFENRVMYIRKIKDMEKEGLVNSIFIYKRSKAVKLTNKGLNVCRDKYPQDFVAYCADINKTTMDRLRKNDKRNVMSVKKAETDMTVMAAGIPTAYGDKPMITEHGSKDTRFYSINEIRGYVKVNGGLDPSVGTRSTGVLLTSDCLYNVYHTGTSRMKWDYDVEKTYVRYLSSFAFDNGYGKGYEVRKSILFYMSDKPLIDMFNMGTKRDENNVLSNVLNMGDNIIAIPYDMNGLNLLAGVINSEWVDSIYDAIVPERKDRSLSTAVDCDDFADNTYTLVYCIPDIARLYRFVEQAKVAKVEYKFVIYIYDWQKDFIDSVCGKYDNISVSVVESE